MPDNAQARLMVKEYFISIGKSVLQDNDNLLERLVNMPSENFKNISFPVSDLLDGCYYMGCSRCEYEETTNAGLPLELFSDFCHSFIFCFTNCSKEEIERGHNTFRNYTLVQKREVRPQELCPYLPSNVNVEEDFYIVWTIYRRNDDIASDFGPKYFSVLAMNGDVLGNYGVIFYQGKHKPLCVTLPAWGINWSNETFRHCHHSPPTREVVRYQFVPQASHLVNMFFSHAYSKPEYFLLLQPFTTLGDMTDDFGSADLYRNFFSNFPTKVLEIPSNLCRNGEKGNYILYR